jgi:orotate phosphoribosyltransferase
MIFRENSEMMIKGKHVLLLLASATTGQTILRAGESIDYYGGTVVGITAIFSAPTKVFGQQIHSLYKIADLPDYRSYNAAECKMCKERIPIDAICNSFGYSKLN